MASFIYSFREAAPKSLQDIVTPGESHYSALLNTHTNLAKLVLVKCDLSNVCTEVFVRNRPLSQVQAAMDEEFAAFVADPLQAEKVAELDTHSNPYTTQTISPRGVAGRVIQHFQDPFEEYPPGDDIGIFIALRGI